MALKTHSQWLLLALLPDAARQTEFVSLSSVRLLFPHLTTAGFRSLVDHLQTKGMVHYERVGQHSQLYLSELGKMTVYALFPALDPERLRWAGNWSCLVFQEAPTNDTQFRYLRRVLVERRAIQLTRGVYLYPGAFPAMVVEQCHRLYTGAISIFSIASVQFGSLRPIVVEKGELKTLQELYSGISSECRQLLGMNDQTGLLTDQQKVRFVSLFDRLVSALRGDNGLGSYYFPDDTWGKEVLQYCRTIVLL
ncbi:MAG: hypothetical protein UY10_C0024G0002 [Microgenomates group bacterium GW2011_GWA2_47_8]|nr:MAG: hypothetical protein UY10_C0024G0002 [Microgenomates group bacterium GW2011_GWA2_47_8]